MKGPKRKSGKEERRTIEKPTKNQGEALRLKPKGYRQRFDFKKPSEETKKGN